jgi:uncharacterized membrane protein
MQQTKTNFQNRYWEIDSWRGLVVITMIIFHLMWDLWFFRVLPNIVLHAGFWKYFQRFTACSFIFLAGVSLAITYQRQRQKPNFTLAGASPQYLLRGLRIFAWGMLFTLVAWLAGIGYVHFGVLHLIGFAIAAAYPFLEFRWLNLALWAVFFVAGGWIQQQQTATWAWVWLGLKPPAYAPLDYFPILPWFGVVLLGIGIGNLLYRPDGRIFSLPDLSPYWPIRFLRFLGSHSLPIYLLHQPALFAILIALGIISLPA